MMFYKFVKEQDSLFKTILLDYHNSFSYFYNVSLENIKLLELHYINQTTITEKKFLVFLTLISFLILFLIRNVSFIFNKLYERQNQKVI